MEIQGYNMPDDLHYEENHYWVRVDGDLLVMGWTILPSRWPGKSSIFNYRKV